MSASTIGSSSKITRSAAARVPIVTESRSFAFESVGKTFAIFAEEMKYVLNKDHTHGCGSVAVSTVGCGPAGPGSSPGHGPKPLPKVLIVDYVSHPFCLSHQIVSILLANPHNQW